MNDEHDDEQHEADAMEELLERFRREHPSQEFDDERFRATLAGVVAHHPNRDAIIDRLNHGARFYARPDTREGDPVIVFSVGWPNLPEVFGKFAGRVEEVATVDRHHVLR